MFTSDSANNAQNQWLEDLLARQSDALAAGEDDFEPTLTSDYSRFAVTPAQTAEADQLFSLARSLNQAFEPVEPSEAFMARLQEELIGEPQVNLLVRWKKLPAHYQLAAKLGGLTITAGLMLIAARTGINTLNSLQHRNNSDSDSALSLNTASGA